MLRTVTVEGMSLTYELERKNVKNINLRVRPDGSVYASASRSVPVSRVDDFVRSKAAFILAAQQRQRQRQAKQPPAHRYETGEVFYILAQPVTLTVQPGPRGQVALEGTQLRLTAPEGATVEQKKKWMDKFFLAQCQRVFAQVLDRLCPQAAAYGVPRPQLRVRWMKSRWGSCMPGKGIVTLNARLLAAPMSCIEYVAMHELCHFLHADHSPAFYASFTALMPDWPARKQLLREASRKYMG
jgi:predicted metal-dependent hydrolase